MKVCILTEGGLDIGFGHIARCGALYDAFLKNKIIPKFLINGDSTVKGMLKGKRHKIFNWLDERGLLFDLIENSDIIILDSYLAGSDIYEIVSKITKIPVYIDDAKRLKYPKGIVVNGTLGAEKIRYPGGKDRIYLTGGKYVLLRKEFWKAPLKKINGKIEKIMITFGGDDINNMTPLVIKLFKENFPSLFKYVIVGKAFRDIKKIESLRDRSTNLVYYPDAKKLKELMLKADLVISAGGQTLYELARVGVPVIAVTTAKNQIFNMKGSMQAGFIEEASWWADPNINNRLLRSFESLAPVKARIGKSNIGRRLVDGKGACEVARYLINHYTENR